MFESFAYEVTERKQAEALLLRSRARLESLTHRLLGVQEAERRRMARELHDELGQQLTAIKLNLEATRRAVRDSPAAAVISESLALINQGIGSVRALALDLRPSLLDDLGLLPAIEWYLRRQAQRAGIEFELDAPSGFPRLSSDVETTCYRVIQEALTNAMRHAQAGRLVVRARAASEEVEFTVEDDGLGFDPTEALERGHDGESFGLHSMQERAALVGGRLDIVSAHGRGTVLRLIIPRRDAP